MFNITIKGVISKYNEKSGVIRISRYSSETKNFKSYDLCTKNMGLIKLKPGDQVSAAISDDLKELLVIEKLESKKLDNFKEFFISTDIEGTSMKDRIRMFNAFGADVLNLAKDRIALIVNSAVEYGYETKAGIVISANAEKLKILFQSITLLNDVGFQKNDVKFLRDKFGLALGHIVSENPYMLLVGGITRFSDPFSNANKNAQTLNLVDKLVDNHKLPKWTPLRHFYVLEMIVKRLEGNGSTAYSKLNVANEMATVLGISYDGASQILDDTLIGKGYKVVNSGADGYFITPSKNYVLEESVAEKLISRLNTKDTEVSSRDLLFESYYTDEQRQSIRLAIEKNLVVITGGAGTGKTTVIKGIIQNVKKFFGKQSEILLCAPTGKAAQRMSEATSLDAKTIHSLLKFNPDKGFMEANIPEGTKIVIIDEASMIDSALMLNLLTSIPQETKIVLVGDIKQILPVKPGQPFKDIILSEYLPTVRLSVPQRTGNKSHIYLNANKIINGVMPSLKNDDMHDFHFFPTSNDAQTKDVILKILAEDIETIYGSSLKSVQIISPKREPKGEVGMDGLNRGVQRLLNPNVSKALINSDALVPEVSDKVVFNRNNYNLRLFNGDVGYVTRKDVKTGTMSINVDGKVFDLTANDVKSLSLAFALSAHKTQGSEYDVVIMPLSKGHSHMLSPELLYTAITRAKKHFIFVGDEDVIRSALRNVALNKRDTYLKARLVSSKMEMNNEMVESVITPTVAKEPQREDTIIIPEATKLPEKKDNILVNKDDVKQSKSVEDDFEWNFNL